MFTKMVDSFRLRGWFSSDPGVLAFENGLNEHGMYNYMTHVDNCGDLSLLLEDPSELRPVGKGADAADDGDFLQPAVTSCTVADGPDSTKLIVRGVNLHFLNTAHPRFCVLTCGPITTDRVVVESAVDGELTLRVPRGAEYLLDSKRRRITRVYLRKCFDAADDPAADFEDTSASAAYVAVYISDGDGAQLACDAFADGEPSLEMFKTCLLRLCLDLAIRLQPASENDLPNVSRVDAVIAQSAEARSLAELCDVACPRQPGEFAKAVKAALVKHVEELADLRKEKPEAGCVFLKADALEALFGLVEPIFKEAIQNLRARLSLQIDGTQHLGEDIRTQRRFWPLLRCIVYPFWFTSVSWSIGTEIGGVRMKPYSFHLAESLYFMSDRDLRGLLHTSRSMERSLRDLAIAGNLTDVTESDKPCPKWLTDGTDRTFPVFKKRTFAGVSASLMRSSQLQTLQFIRNAMCLSQIRNLLDAIFITFVGEARVGKSALLKALFKLDIRAGWGAANQSKHMSAFHLSADGGGGGRAPITVFDSPGTTDSDAVAAATFSQTFRLASMTVIVRQLERGRREASHVRATLAGDGSDRPFCVVVPHLDAEEVPEDPVRAEKRIAEMRAEVAGSMGVDARRVHLFWNDHVRRETQRGLADYFMEQPAFKSRTVESVREFLFDQLMEQLPRLKEFKDEVKRQLGIQSIYAALDTI